MMKLHMLPVGPIQANCYILCDEEEKKCAVIDPGGEGAKVARCAMELFENTFGVKPEECQIQKRVKGSRYPLFLCAGSTEKLEELFDALRKANPQETEILILPGCAHGNGMYKQTELYQGRLTAFAARCTGDK